jgi:hypothetical protein
MRIPTIRIPSGLRICGMWRVAMAAAAFDRWCTATDHKGPSRVNAPVEGRRLKLQLARTAPSANNTSGKTNSSLEQPTPNISTTPNICGWRVDHDPTPTEPIPCTAVDAAFGGCADSSSSSSSAWPGSQLFGIVYHSTANRPPGRRTPRPRRRRQPAAGLDIFPKGWVSELLILRFRAGLRPPHHPPDYFITGLEPS